MEQLRTFMKLVVVVVVMVVVVLEMVVVVLMVSGEWLVLYCVEVLHHSKTS